MSNKTGPAGDAAGPTFIVIGAGKAGSTSLCDLLATHPEVFVTTPKEPRFFTSEYARGMSWYLDLFAPGVGCRARGEGSVDYTMRDKSPQVAARIHRHFPHLRLLYIVRHPVERIISNWRMFKTMTPSAPGLDECLADRRHDHFLVNRSRYAWQLEPYRAAFPADQLHVLFLEDLAADQPAVLRRCFEFIGVSGDASADLPLTVSNRAGEQLFPSPWWDRLRRVPGVQALRRLAGPRLAGALVRPFYRTTVPPPDVSEDTRRRLADELRDETVAFLREQGKPDDFWKL